MTPPALYYYGARYYDADLSRFIMPDTIYDAGPQGLNRYSYALNNPLRYLDPTGHLSVAAHFNPDDDDTWVAPPTIFQESDDFVDLGDGMKATIADVNAARFGVLSAPPRLSFWRRNFVSRYVGDVLMFAESVLTKETSSWSDCDRITRECYSTKESFDRRFGVFTDLAGTVIGAATTKMSAASKNVFNFKRPASRHTLTSVNQKTVAKNLNTVIEPGVDVAADVAAINNGLAQKVGDTFIINGRTYGMHDSRLFPLSGSGFHQLDRASFKALGVFNQFGNTAKAKQILNNMGLSDEAVNAALKAWGASQ